MSEENKNNEAKEEQGSGLEGVDFAPGRGKPNPGGNGVGNGAATAEKGDEAPADGAAEESAGEPESELDAAKREIAELKESWTRERAEFTNYRKRQVQEKARFRGQAVGDFVQSLLPAFDNLDRVLSADTEDPAVKNFVIGVDMIKQEMLQALEAAKIKSINPAGEAFDPFSMEAIAMEDRDDLEQETVLEVFQPGYVYEGEDGDRHVLRPARVKVGKPARAANAAGSAEETAGAE